MTEEYQAKTLNPSRGAPVRFKGRIIADHKWGTGKYQPNGKEVWMRFTVWETKGGAYIAQISGDVPGNPDHVHCSVGVVEPIHKPADNSGWMAEINANLRGENPGASALTTIEHVLRQSPERDDTAMQMAVLDAFDWHDRAKAMLKRELGWSPWRDVA